MPGLETSLWTVSYLKHPSQQKISYFKIKLKITQLCGKRKGYIELPHNLFQVFSLDLAKIRNKLSLSWQIVKKTNVDLE